VKRRTDFCLTWLWQVTIYMIIVALKLPLSILWTEYETPAVGERVTSRQANVEDSTEARHTTLEGA